MVDNDETALQVDWSLKGYMINIIGKALDNATLQFVAGNEVKAFRQIQGVRMIINPYLSERESKELESFEEKLTKKHSIESTFNKGFESFESRIQKPENKKIALEYLSLVKNNLFKNYHKQVMDALKRYGFLLGAKEDETSIGYD